jgi:hypothetical protein
MDRLQVDERRRTHLPAPLIHPDRSPGPFIPDFLRPRAAPFCCGVKGVDRIVCDLAKLCSKRCPDRVEADRKIANELRSPMPDWKKNEQQHALG